LETHYKRDEIRSYFYDWIKENAVRYYDDYGNDWLDDLHHYAFNVDDYIIGIAKAEEWLGREVFNIIRTIEEYCESTFGTINCMGLFSCPEKIVNVYVYIVGQELVHEYLSEFRTKGYVRDFADYLLSETLK
jgi:hypothetical protein